MKIRITAARRSKIGSSALMMRRSAVPDGDKFDPVEFIEHRLPFKYGTDFYEIRENLHVRELKVDAFVTFEPKPRIVICEQTYLAAIAGDGASRFTLAHEIGHLELHKEIARRKRSELLARGVPGSGTSFLTNEIEEE